jgi:uncharacterized protein (TIGR04255 family)
LDLFWSAIREEFPECQNASPIGAPFAAPDEIFPLTRYWFISRNESNLIQLQRNRFYLNCRNRKGGEKYSSFQERSASFFARFTQLEKFVAENNLGSLRLDYAELSYTNHFSSRHKWKTLDDTKRIIKSFNLIDTGEMSAQVDAILYQSIFNLRETSGPLSIKLQNGIDDDTQEAVLVYELKRHTERTFEQKHDLEIWFSQANEELDVVFESTTTLDAQKLWGRIAPTEREKKR